MANDLKVNIRGDGSQLSSELTRTASEVAKLERQAKQAQKELNSMTKSATNLKGGLKDLMGGIKSLDFSSISNGISSIGSNASSVLPNLGKLATSLVNPYTLAGTAILGAGKALFDYNVELEKSLQRTAQFTGLSGDELMSLRNGIKSVADTFGKDYNDVLSSVDGLMCQFGISGEEALTTIKNGFVGGCDDGGKMLDLISKYSGSFKDAGISASELVAIIGNTRSGIFNEDGMELISKGATKIREFSSTLQSSLDAIGISSTEMYAKLQSGEITTVQALQSISSKLKELNPQSKEVGDVLSSVFGKQGAKAGYELVTALADVETNLDKVKEQTGDWGVAMEQLQQADREFENALSSLFGVADGGFSTMTTKLKAEVYGAVAKCINGFIDWYNKSLVVRYAVHSIATAFKNAWEIIKAILKLFMNSLKSLAELIEGVLTLDWNKVKNSWKNGLNGILKTVATGFENIKQNYQDGLDSVLNGEIKKIEVPVEASYSTNNNSTSNNNSSSKSGSEKGSKTTKKDTSKTENKEVVKTQLELDREEFDKQEKAIKQAIEDFNKGLTSKEELTSILSNANKFFSDKNYKKTVEVEYKIDENGYEQAIEKKPVKLPTELELKRESFQKAQTEINQVKDDFNNGFIDKSALETKVEEINQLLRSIGAEPVLIEVKADGIDIIDETTDKLNKLRESQERAKEVASLNQQAYQSLSSIFGSLGSAIDGTAGKFLELAGQTISAIGQIIPQIVALIGAKQGEALASGTASAASLPFPANIAAIASVIATITALFASFAGSFANGGIIGGATTIGDFNIARVNKGEMILNGSQQGKLFSMLNSNGFYSASSDGGGSVHFKIQGKDLVGVLSNYNKKVNRVM